MTEQTRYAIIARVMRRIEARGREQQADRDPGWRDTFRIVGGMQYDCYGGGICFSLMELLDREPLVPLVDREEEYA